jgi:hypothetical protein
VNPKIEELFANHSRPQILIPLSYFGQALEQWVARWQKGIKRVNSPTAFIFLPAFMSLTFTEDNIDPVLLAMDPTFAFLQNVKAASASGPSPSASASGSNSPSLDSPGSNEEDTMDQSPDTPVPSGSNVTAPLVAFGRLVKRQTELTEQSTVAFDQFCAVSLWLS